MGNRKQRTTPSSPAVAATIRNPRSNASTPLLLTPTIDTTTKTDTIIKADTTTKADTATKATIKGSIKVDTNVPSVDVNPALLNRLSPSVRDVAEHAAALRSVLAQLGPIYDLVEKEVTRMTEVSPFLAGKDQVCHTNMARISDTDLLYHPGGRREKSLGRRGAETRGEDPCHQGYD